ncbi:TPA: hypothetical protein MAR76_002862 [Klebsiella pneumoniae]|nr:hypothetical protein [Klebsiella pneumoniae]HBS7735324.1 hypothetical protein [Klebsiella pneumoniae]HBS7756413.1 hypothetical protein [Klebsiella pneumoniae]HBS7767238.1 hypothetical protein [Klebsiella pneumoniae]
MKERGMIFNGEMTRAILDGRKTQTRREVKLNLDIASLATTYDWATSLAANHYQGLTEEQIQQKAESLRGVIHPVILGNGQMVSIICPHGKPGDRIWVRETWAILGNEDGCCIDWEEKLCKADERSAARIYRASCEQKPGNYGLWSIPDDADWKPHTKDYQYEGAWRPSIHMPRWASRILLEITGVRVERLNAISEEDVDAEGFAGDYPTSVFPNLFPGEPKDWSHLSMRDCYGVLWESIYGEGSWKANPWVWVIEFKRVEGGAA